jgi:hypothetical protein
MAGLVNIDTAGIGNLISGIGSAAKDIRAAITGKSVIDPTAQAALDEKLAEIEAQSRAAQSAVNAAEAASPSTFVSGWRPFIGWVSGLGFAYVVLLRPLLVGIFKISFPDIDSSMVITVLGGILGLGTMRTVEKLGNAQGNH